MTGIDTLIGAIGAPLAVLAAALALVWVVLLLALPFVVFGAWKRAKQCAGLLERLVELEERRAQDR